MATPIEIVTHFCGQWDKDMDQVRAAIRQNFTAQTVWDNVGWACTTGPDEAIALWETFPNLGFQQIRVDMRHIAATGDIVLTERIDHLIGLDGTVLVSARLMGVFELVDGKIMRWCDYTDPGVFGSVPPPAQ